VTGWSVALAAAVVAGLAVAWWHARRDAAALRRRLVSAAGELEHLQAAFSRFAPPEIVDRIASGRPAPAEKREVTILFADLVGFTTLGDSLDAELLVDVLNDHCRRMSRVVSDHRGHVAKFIGDGLMALFGAHEPNPWQASDAAHAALAMQAAVDEHNAALATRGLAPLRMGIGIHRGVAIAGVIGSAELQEFTVIGTAVNLAARVERLTRMHGVPVLLTAAVRAHLDPRFVVRELPANPVRGMAEPVTTFSLEGFAA
jgi:class 3 adenylate cyclase